MPDGCSSYGPHEIPSVIRGHLRVGDRLNWPRHRGEIGIQDRCVAFRVDVRAPYVVGLIGDHQRHQIRVQLRSSEIERGIVWSLAPWNTRVGTVRIPLRSTSLAFV